MTSTPTPHGFDRDNPLFQQQLDTATGVFSINGLIDSIEAHTQAMLQQSAQAQAALNAASGTGEYGVVSLRVDATGTITELTFSSDLESTSTASLNRHLLQAHRLAVRDANRQLSAWSPAFGDLIAQAAPALDDESAVRSEALTTSSDEAPAPAPAQVPADPGFDDWLSILDTEEDFGVAVQKMKESAPFSVPELDGLSGAEIDQMFQLENQRTADNVRRLQSELRTIEGSADGKQVGVRVNAAGVVTAVDFHAPAIHTEAEELASQVLSMQSQARSDAEHKTRQLLAQADLDQAEHLNLLFPSKG